MRNTGILVLLVMTLCACASLDERKRSVSFETAILQYEQSIRWGDFSAANRLRRPDVPAAITPTQPGEQIRITACETVQVTASSDGNETAVVMKITYYHDDGMTLKTLVDQQLWKYDTEHQAWYISSPPPVFR